jgi:hypothetical protein
MIAGESAVHRIGSGARPPEREGESARETSARSGLVFYFLHHTIPLSALVAWQRVRRGGRGRSLVDGAHSGGGGVSRGTIAALALYAAVGWVGGTSAVRSHGRREQK